jgi:hypothetical protein
MAPRILPVFVATVIVPPLTILSLIGASLPRR